MDAHLSEPITITGLCAEIDSPIHNLERAFSKVHGVNPRQFLNLRRLTALRGMLLSHEPGETSVTEAALSCGLTHLGRVAARYKALFAESPSVTLKRPVKTNQNRPI
jgi:AraC-like DNA-binding protein